MNEEVQPPMRRIVNSNIGVTNIFEEKDVKTTMMKTFDELVEILKSHCGPYSNYAIITDPTQPTAEPIFTKDGINIIRAIEYASPIQEFVKQNLAYIGSRVETAASDGTTSAMIVTAIALKYLVKELSNIPISGYELEHIFKKNILERIKMYYNKDCGFVYTKKRFLERNSSIREKDIVKYLAYSQVYTSSHGDTELAKAVSELFASTPEEAWSYMHIEKTQYETNEKYSIKIDHAQWHIENARFFPLNKLVDDFGTSYKKDSIPCCICNRIPSVGDPATEHIRNTIESSVKEGKPYLFICDDKLDTATTNWLNNLFNSYPDHNVVFILVPEGEYGMNSDTMFIPLLTGKVPGPETYLDSIKCSFTSSGFDIISGLYEDTDTSNVSRMHYFLTDKEKYKVYNETIDYLDKCIDAQKKAVASRRSNAAVSHLMKIRNKLTIINRASFIIGGSAYDNAAAVDVVSDAIPAVKHILTKGFVQSSFRSLYRVIDTIGTVNELKNNNTDKEIKVTKAYVHAFCSAIEQLHMILSDTTKSKYHKKFYPNLNENLLVDKSPEYTVENMVNIFARMMSDKDITLQGDNIVMMQPVETDLTLVERFGEVALKFIKACRVITPGGVVIHKK